MFRDAKAKKTSSKAFKADKETVQASADIEMMMATATAPTEPHEADFLEIEEEEAAANTSMGGMNTLPTEIVGEDNSIRLLMREGRKRRLLTTCIDSSTLILVFTPFIRYH